MNSSRLEVVQTKEGLVSLMEGEGGSGVCSRCLPSSPLPRGDDDCHLRRLVAEDAIPQYPGCETCSLSDSTF